MKKTRSKKSDELRPEYDFSKLGPGVRGKYYKRMVGRPIVVELVPDSALTKPRAAKRKAAVGRKRKRADRD